MWLNSACETAQQPPRVDIRLALGVKNGPLDFVVLDTISSFLED